jgi:Subtilase family
MRSRLRATAALVPAATAVAFAVLCTPVVAAQAISPLAPSNYTVRGVCPPPALGQASCLALRLLPRTAQARAHTHPLTPSAAGASTTPSPAAGDFGLRPRDIHSAYQLPNSASTAQTIAVVDAYNDPTAAGDLNAYDKEFGLGECTSENGCFRQVNQEGEAGNPPFPTSAQELQQAAEGSPEEAEEAEEAEGWSVEISLDVEVARATCQSCKIVLVESDSTSDADLDQAEQTAVALGADEVSNSWGGPECIEAGAFRECIEDSSAFEHPGVVITASAGDDGYLGWDGSQPGFAEYPASSPHVVAVGGTRLLLNGAGAWSDESVWNDGGEKEGVKDGYGAGGGGCSVQFTAPPWQQSVADWSTVGCSNRRAVSDVSADADPYTGFAVHDSSSACEEEVEPGLVLHWCMIGGTSLSSPLIASVFALAGGAHGVEYPARTLYENELASPASLHDVTIGSNGKCHRPFDEGTGQSGCTIGEQAAASCSSQTRCLARAGYDGPTGVGTPDGIEAFQPPAAGKGPSTGFGVGEEGGGSAPRLGPPGPVSTTSTATTSGLTPTGTGTRSAHVTRLALTLGALIALNRSRPTMRQLAFDFTIDLASHVAVSLARRLRVHGHARWRVLAHPLTIAAVIGRNTSRLGGRGPLSQGLYRLTLSPVRGTARSITFTIG